MEHCSPVKRETPSGYEKYDSLKRGKGVNPEEENLISSLRNKIRYKLSKLNLNELKIIDNKIEEIYQYKFNNAKKNIEVLYSNDIRDLNNSMIIKNNRFCNVRVVDNNKEIDSEEKIAFIKQACKKFCEDYDNGLKNTK